MVQMGLVAYWNSTPRGEIARESCREPDAIVSVLVASPCDLAINIFHRSDWREGELGGRAPPCRFQWRASRASDVVEQFVPPLYVDLGWEGYIFQIDDVCAKPPPRSAAVVVKGIGRAAERSAVFESLTGARFCQESLDRCLTGLSSGLSLQERPQLRNEYDEALDISASESHMLWLEHGYRGGAVYWAEVAAAKCPDRAEAVRAAVLWKSTRSEATTFAPVHQPIDLVGVRHKAGGAGNRKITAFAKPVHRWTPFHQTELADADSSSSSSSPIDVPSGSVPLVGITDADHATSLLESRGLIVCENFAAIYVDCSVMGSLPFCFANFRSGDTGSPAAVGHELHLRNGTTVTTVTDKRRCGNEDPSALILVPCGVSPREFLVLVMQAARVRVKWYNVPPSVVDAISLVGDGRFTDSKWNGFYIGDPRCTDAEQAFRDKKQKFGRAPVSLEPSLTTDPEAEEKKKKRSSVNLQQFSGTRFDPVLARRVVKAAQEHHLRCHRQQSGGGANKGEKEKEEQQQQLSWSVENVRVSLFFPAEGFELVTRNGRRVLLTKLFERILSRDFSGPTQSDDDDDDNNWEIKEEEEIRIAYIDVAASATHKEQEEEEDLNTQYRFVYSSEGISMEKTAPGATPGTRRDQRVECPSTLGVFIQRRLATWMLAAMATRIMDTDEGKTLYSDPPAEYPHPKRFERCPTVELSLLPKFQQVVYAMARSFVEALGRVGYAVSREEDHGMGGDATVTTKKVVLGDDVHIPSSWEPGWGIVKPRGIGPVQRNDTSKTFAGIAIVRNCIGRKVPSRLGSTWLGDVDIWPCNAAWHKRRRRRRRRQRNQNSYPMDDEDSGDEDEEEEEQEEEEEEEQRDSKTRMVVNIRITAGSLTFGLKERVYGPGDSKTDTVLLEGASPYEEDDNDIQHGILRDTLARLVLCHTRMRADVNTLLEAPVQAPAPPKSKTSTTPEAPPRPTPQNNRALAMMTKASRKAKKRD